MSLKLAASAVLLQSDASWAQLPPHVWPHAYLAVLNKCVYV